MYKFFSTTNGVKALKKYRLYAICTDIFDYPIDFLHESLSSRELFGCVLVFGAIILSQIQFKKATK